MRVSSEGAIVVYFSTKFELFESENFAIYEGDPGFKETGLSESSYLVSSHGVPVKWTFFDQVKLLGELIPELNDRVGDWWGEPI